jgi:hypothetical protein
MQNQVWRISWCAREDLNLQPLRDQILSLARLPFRHARVRAKHASKAEKAQAVSHYRSAPRPSGSVHLPGTGAPTYSGKNLLTSAVVRILST